MAKPEKIASRYAKAIYESCQGASRVSEVLDELQKFSQLVGTSPELQRVFSTEVILNAERRGVVDDLAKRLSLSEASRRILLVISDAKRLEILPTILERLRVMLLEAANVIPMRVLAANTLTAEEKTKVEERFHKILGRQVEASYVIDPGLIGGLRVTAGSRTFDGTLAGWLASFEEQLVGGAI